VTERSSPRAVSRQSTAVLWLLFCLTGPVRLHAEPGGTDCAVAAGEAEQANAVPQGLLLAVGRIESGRPNPGTHRVEPWPWTINAAGTGQFFAAKADAAAAVASLQMRGVRSIDVGCFQVNLLHHPFAFATLDEAFDPAANARYAAHLLAELHSRFGAWPEAVAAYHSATPGLGEPYRDAVLNAWRSGGEFRLVDDETTIAAGVRVFVPSWAGRRPPPPSRPGLPRVITPTAVRPIAPESRRALEVP
jgi:hypothetical protein